MSATLTGPEVSDTHVVFALPDADRELRSVRLAPALSTTAELDFRPGPAGWTLDLDRPPVRRMEYRIQRGHADGGFDDIVDPANPLSAPGAFGDKSVVLFPDYRPPEWLAAEVEDGSYETLAVPTRGLGGPIELAVWTPPGAVAGQALPLLIVHDGPEYERMAGLTRYAGSLIAAGQVPAFRLALLAPGERNERYSAKNVYARALVGSVLPAIEAIAPIQGRPVGMGASLGALAMLHAHRAHRGVFGGLFLQSGSFFDLRLDPQERTFGRYPRVTRFVVATRRPAEEPDPIPVRLTCGAAEENLGNNRQVTGALLAQGYPARLTEVPDAHNYTAWRDAFAPTLGDLLTDVWS